MARRKICQADSVLPLSWAIWFSLSNISAPGVPASPPSVPITPVATARKYATNSEPIRLPTSTRPKFEVSCPSPTRLRIAANGTSAMLPVSRSEPATTTRISPMENTAPANRVGSVPHVAGSRPAVTAMETRPPKAMYAPARKPPTSALSQLTRAFLTPVSTAASVISSGAFTAGSATFPPQERNA